MLSYMTWHGMHTSKVFVFFSFFLLGFNIVAGITGRELMPNLAKQYDKEKVDNSLDEQKAALVQNLEKHKLQQSKVLRVTAIGTAMTVENTVKNVETQVCCDS